ncbi:DUF1018 domain-containing protein [Duganella sp. FT50W]|uniref:DUF1018 domain-containing protein n=1 Tax=Duganella lactea TaxID=2692173 RepID=A0A6L8MMQ3_9BURK|nr:regulatory protein GemA [Duganella lactea]MYM80558.1 DUF1018 domain-containing protein [Duganella lactea]
MRAKNSEQQRKADLALIHVAKKALQLDDDAYRAILVNVTGKSSSASLNTDERQAVLDRFKKVGFKIEKNNAGRTKPKAAPQRAQLVNKIEAQLADAKRPWAYADGMAKRICGIERIEFCQSEHLVKIIAALSYDAKRRQAKQ